MRRRDFIAAIGAVPALWPLAGRAQQPALPVVGFLRSSTRAPFEHLLTAFRHGLQDGGFIEGQNVAVDVRFADNDRERLLRMVDDIVRQPVAVIVGNLFTAIAAKAATKTLPIVFVTGTDPVQDGLVESLNRPGGNITGVSFLATEVRAKRLELLHRLVPKAATIAVLAHRNSPQGEVERKDLPPAAQAMGVRLLFSEVESEPEIDAAIATAAQSGVGALFFGGGAFINSHRDRLIALAARHGIPSSFLAREAVVEGGLMSYGPSQTEAYRRAGGYAARILKGEKPGDLPVVRSDKHEFVLNLKTAKALGLDIPPTVIALADEVIE